jgi:hypothetical protein
MYELVDSDLGVGLVPLDRSVPDGTSLLVAGPSMTRTERVVFAVLATGHAAEEGVTAVSTESGEATVDATFGDIAGTVEESRFGVVDCTGGSGEGLSGPGRVQHVPSPSDLTGVGIGITRAMESLDVRVPRHRLGFHSLSTLLLYRSPSVVFKFCHVLASRVGDLGGLAVLTLDTDAHDEQTVNMVARAFDGAIDVRPAPETADHDRAHELRLRGLDASRSWSPVDLP